MARHLPLVVLPVRAHLTLSACLPYGILDLPVAQELPALLAQFPGLAHDVCGQLRNPKRRFGAVYNLA